MKVTTARTIIAFGAVASCSGFVSPVGRQPLGLQPNLRDYHSTSALQPPRGDVSVGLFRDLFKKLKGDDGDDDDETKPETKLETEPETKPDEVVSVQKEEAEKEDEVVPFVTTSYLNSLEEDDQATAAGANVDADADSDAEAEATTIEAKSEAEATTVEAETEVTIVEAKVDEAPTVTIEETPVVEAVVEVEAPVAPIEQTPAVEVVVEVVKEKEELSPLAQAEKLRAQAARVRLEADKQQVELTLGKIDKLNSKLEKLKKKDVVNLKDQESLEKELQMLKSQLITDEKGEVKPVAAPVKVVKKESSSADTAASSATIDSVKISRTSLSAEEMAKQVKRFQEAPEFMKVLVAKTLGFGVDESTPGSVDRLNATDIVQKLYDDKIDYESIIAESDFSNASDEEKARAMLERAFAKSASGDGDKPVFTEEQIQAKVKELEDVPMFLRKLVNKELFDNDQNDTQIATMLLEDEWMNEKKKGGGKSAEKPVFTKEQIDAKVEELKQIPPFFKNVVPQEFNDTEVALLLLEEEWESEQNKGKGLFGLFGDNNKEKGEIGRDGERMDIDQRGTFSRLFSEESALNGTESGAQSDLTFLMESLYPKSIRKEGETPEKKQVDAFLNDVVAPTKSFVPSDNPISVPGGWIIRGKNLCESGDDLIEKLDRRMANDARLREKISFYVLKDPFPNPEEQMVDPLNWPPVLFVAGPSVAREPEVLLRTAISSIGIATAWYGSIYPFLANPKLLDRANDAMELADAGMSSDMSWLSEMSIPLFVTFMALQVTHESAHLAVATLKDFEISIPTLVPSFLSGITNSITSLKSSPKNKSDLVDFAVAGPLAGMIGSILVLCYGLVLTATADAASLQSFPGLPLIILRQSTLGGGLIDLILGNGVLNVPASAEAAQALASTLISLHPLAVAGFFSLVVNALALIPAGRTDGGRISMALFGRSGSQAVTLMSLAFLGIIGFTQNDDVLLFYFAFISFAQSELEIPMRNEIDDVGIPQVLLATFAGFLMLLTVIPMS